MPDLKSPAHGIIGAVRRNVTWQLAAAGSVDTRAHARSLAPFRAIALVAERASRFRGPGGDMLRREAARAVHWGCRAFSLGYESLGDATSSSLKGRTVLITGSTE